jgi:hypothetical protein
MGRNIRCKSLGWWEICYVGLYDEGSVQILQGSGVCIGWRIFFCGLDGYQSERLFSCTRISVGMREMTRTHLAI